MGFEDSECGDDHLKESTRFVCRYFFYCSNLVMFRIPNFQAKKFYHLSILMRVKHYKTSVMFLHLFVYFAV